MSETTTDISPRRPRGRDSVRTLFVGKRRALQIERDAKYPQMWRVKLPDGTLSDMVNLARAKEAAMDIAEGIEARKRPHKSPDHGRSARRCRRPSRSGAADCPRRARRATHQ